MDIITYTRTFVFKKLPYIWTKEREQYIQKEYKFVIITNC